MPPRSLVIAFVVIAGLLAACAEPSATQTPAERPSAGSFPPPTETDGDPSPAGRSPTPTAAPTPAPTVSPDPPPLALAELVTGFNSPTNITSTPDGWLLVNERSGRMLAVDEESGETSLVVDLSDRVTQGVTGSGERGLLGLAVHPDWPATARVFVNYTDQRDDTVISELRATVDDGPPIVDADSERVLLRQDQPYVNHNGGQLAFGPDGYLWIGLGDGGGRGDPHGNGQDPRTLLGSILRLDVSEPGAYAIPDDNPFASGDDGAPEVYLWGLRNPWRFSFDRAVGSLWVADVGQNQYEEINRLDPEDDAGANLGWAIMEASHCYEAAECPTEGLTMPISEYGRDDGCSVTGGYVYRGSAIPDLAGWYLFGDYCSGVIFGLSSDVEVKRGEIAEPRVLLETGVSITTFGEGADGELYLADLGSGTIYRVVEGG